MAKKLFTVKVKYVFEGEYKVNAESKDEAKKIVKNSCGLVMGGNIHTNTSNEIVTDWEFGTHPETKIVSIK